MSYFWYKLQYKFFKWLPHATKQAIKTKEYEQTVYRVLRDIQKVVTDVVYAAGQINVIIDTANYYDVWGFVQGVEAHSKNMYISIPSDIFVTGTDPFMALCCRVEIMLNQLGYRTHHVLVETAPNLFILTIYWEVK